MIIKIIVITLKDTIVDNKISHLYKKIILIQTMTNSWEWYKIVLCSTVKDLIMDNLMKQSNRKWKSRFNVRDKKFKWKLRVCKCNWSKDNWAKYNKQLRIM